MPPKQTVDPAIVAALKSVVGLDDKGANDFAKNADRAKLCLEFFSKLPQRSASASADDSAKKNTMLFSAFTKADRDAHRDYIATRILDDSLKTTQQTDAAIKFVNALKGDAAVDAKAFDAACGVGVVVTQEQITALVTKELESMPRDSLAATWRKSPDALLGRMKKVDALRWADFTVVKAVVASVAPGLVPAEDPAAEKAAPAKKPGHKDPATAAAAAKPRDWRMQKDFKEVAQGLEITKLGAARTLPEGSTIYVQGWAHRVVHSKNISFVTVRDTTSYIQVVFGGPVPEFPRETSLAIRGTIKDEAKAADEKQGRPPKELHVESWAVIGLADPDIENVINTESHQDVLLDQRHIVLRTDAAASAMKVRSYALRAFREHYWRREMFELTPPTLVQTQCEGGSTLFDFLYYGEKAYLTQSSQLYLETAITSVGDAFCILPSYRAEKSKTKRHLAEFTHIEGEHANITFEDLLNIVEDLVVDVFDRTIRMAGDLVARVNPDQLKEGCDPNLPASWKFQPTKPFKRLPYSDAIKFCNEHNILNPDTEAPFKYGEDISDKPERAMVELIGTPVLMTHFPTEMKSFYMARCEGNASLTESVDVLVPGVGEIVGGSMRMWKFDELMDGYKQNHLDPKPYYWYTDQRKYGSVPHGGYGLGLERFLVWLLNLNSVKDACQFPRYMGRCTP